MATPRMSVKDLSLKKITASALLERLEQEGWSAHQVQMKFVGSLGADVRFRRAAEQTTAGSF